MQDIFGTGFLSTTVYWIVGISLASSFALLAYFVGKRGRYHGRRRRRRLFSGILHALFTNRGEGCSLSWPDRRHHLRVGALMRNLPIYIVIVTRRSLAHLWPSPVC